MRVTTAFNRLLKLDGANVTDVEIGADAAASGRIRLQRGRDFRPYRPATDVCEGVRPRGAGALRAGCVARICGR